MVTYSDIKKLFDKGFASEVLFYVKDDVKYSNCWMGINDKGMCWFGLTADGKNAYDYSSFDEMSAAKVFDGKSFAEIWDRIEILEINACDAEFMVDMYLRK